MVINEKVMMNQGISALINTLILAYLVISNTWKSEKQLLNSEKFAGATIYGYLSQVTIDNI